MTEIRPSVIDILRPYKNEAERLLDQRLLNEYRSSFLIYIDSIKHLAKRYSFEFHDNGLEFEYESILHHSYGIRKDHIIDTKIAIVPKGTTHLKLSDDETFDPKHSEFVIKIPGQEQSQKSRYGSDIHNKLFGLITRGYKGKPFFPIITLKSLRTYHDRTPSLFISNLLIDECDSLSALYKNRLKRQIIDQLYGGRMPHIALELKALHVKADELIE
ncbi:MAG: hypothetical protein CMF25_07285 [Kangiellaceae bacterium]|nr:hypothetical protein [Kangiellaceae bacterium]